MLGRRPYNGRSRKEIREQVLAKNVQVKKEEALGWSSEGVDFVNRVNYTFKLLLKKSSSSVSHRID